MLHLVRGDRTRPAQVLRRLADMQYTRNELDLRKAPIACAATSIDIFPAESEREAVRVELFDDEIEALSYFDPLTGEVQRKVPRLTIFPIDPLRDAARAHQRGDRRDPRASCVTRLAELAAHDKLLEAQRLEQRTTLRPRNDERNGLLLGHRELLAVSVRSQAGEPPPCLFDYLPKDALLVIDESHVTIPQLGGMYRGDRSRKETLVEYGFRLPSALDNRPLRFDEWERLAPQMIFVSATPGDYELQHCRQSRGATGAAHGTRRSAGRDPAGAHPGRRRTVGDQASVSPRRASADHDADQAHG